MPEFTGTRIVFEDVGKVVVKSWEQDKPKPGEITLKNVVSIVSAGTELSRLHNYHMAQRPYPTNTGYASVGEVVALGDGVTSRSVGELVLTGMGHLSHLNVSADAVIPVPAGVAPELAVTSALGSISLRAIRQTAPQIGDSILVMGLGIIGQFAQIFARLTGANPVVGVDMSERRLDIAKRTGLRHAVNGKDVPAALAEIVSKGRFNHSIDSTGTPNVIASLPERTAEFGNIVILGGVHKKVEMDLYSFVQKSTQRMIGAGSPDPRDYPYNESRNREVILRLIADGLINVAPLITHDVPVDQAPEMYRMLHEEKDKGMGVVFRWA